VLALREVVHRQEQEDGGRHHEQGPAGDAAQEAGAVERAPRQPQARARAERDERVEDRLRREAQRPRDQDGRPIDDHRGRRVHLQDVGIEALPVEDLLADRQEPGHVDIGAERRPQRQGDGHHREDRDAADDRGPLRPASGHLGVKEGAHRPAESSKTAPTRAAWRRKASAARQAAPGRLGADTARDRARRQDRPFLQARFCYGSGERPHRDGLIGLFARSPFA
jgi:hypothetical protein